MKNQGLNNHFNLKVAVYNIKSQQILIANKIQNTKRL